MENERVLVLAILEAIDQDWALVDERDDHDYMVLVDSNRITREDLKPLKNLVRKMEDEGLVMTGDSYGKREFMKLLGDELHPVPFVYMYRVTSKGRAFEKG